MTTLDDLAKQIDSLPEPIVRAKVDHTATSQRARAKVERAGGKATTIILSPDGNAIVKWALTTPGFPVTQNKVVDDALKLYQEHHRGAHEMRRFWSPEVVAKMDRMLKERPKVTEHELVGLAIKHLFWSFEHSKDGGVDV